MNEKQKRFAVELGRRVKEARLFKEMTQDELAKLSGLHRSTISAVESGARRTEAVSFFLIAGGLGMRPSELTVGIEQAAGWSSRTQQA